MNGTSLLFAGALIGLSVSAPVGPMGILCINRTLASGVATGISTGAGASTVQVLYCAILLLGLHQVGPWLDSNNQLLSLLGAMLMLLFAWRLMRVKWTVQPSRRVGVGSLLVAYGSAVAFNTMNPMLLVLLMGSIASVFGPKPPTEPEIGLLLLGLFVGSVTWWICLSSVTAALRGRLSAGVLGTVNKTAAAVLTGFGLLALMRVFRV